MRGVMTKIPLFMGGVRSTGEGGGWGKGTGSCLVECPILFSTALPCLLSAALSVSGCWIKAFILTVGRSCDEKVISVVSSDEF